MIEEENGFTGLTLEELLRADYESLTDRQKKVRDQLNFLVDFHEDVFEQFEVERKVGDTYLDKNTKSPKFKALQIPIFSRIMWNNKEIEIYSTPQGYEFTSPDNKDIGNKVFDIWEKYFQDSFPSWKAFSKQLNFAFKRNIDSIRKNMNCHDIPTWGTNDTLYNIYNKSFTENEIDAIENFKPSSKINMIYLLPDIMRILRRHAIVKPWIGTEAPPYIINTSGYEILDLWHRFYDDDIDWISFCKYFQFKSTPDNIRKNYDRNKPRLSQIILYEIKKYLTD